LTKKGHRKNLKLVLFKSVNKGYQRQRHFQAHTHITVHSLTKCH